MEAHDVSIREQIFHDRVRETIIFVLFFVCLYILSYLIITHYKKNAEFLTDDSEDATVNRISLWLCTFSLSASVGAVLLLPLSILCNEVLLFIPNSYYVQWLNGSLVHGLWNLVFLFSNLSLVLLLPFAYFFTESEGFVGSRKGVMGRVYETAVVLLLLSMLVLGMVWVASALTHHDVAKESLNDLWDYYLPNLYSYISLFGVLLLLLCTPFGLSRVFSITENVLVKPGLLKNVDEAMSCVVFEEACLSRRLAGGTSCWISLNLDVLGKQFLSIQARRMSLEMRKKASPWQRNVGYPLALLLLLGLTVLCVLMVCFHILELLFDDTAMPRGMKDPLLGAASFSMFGSLGAVVQVILILYPSLCESPCTWGGQGCCYNCVCVCVCVCVSCFSITQLCAVSSLSKHVRYLMASSVVGFYSLPFFTSLLPRARETTLMQIIGNCVSLLMLSSALPVFSRTLGITRFDLLGDFGRYDWLGNFYIVFLYNMLFAGLTSACLLRSITWTMRRELICAVGLHRLPLTVSRPKVRFKLLADGPSKLQ